MNVFPKPSRDTALLILCAALWSVQPASAQDGRLERITVGGPSLDSNLEGDSPDRAVIVYLPSSYDETAERRYPVVYALHGYAMTAELFAQMLGMPESIDRAIADGAREMMVVIPDANTLHGGSFYSNSPVIGDWESFVARDLVAHVDERYRTISEAEARGLMGHSMGGYGALRIAMKRPGVFDSIYSMSACCYSPRGIHPDSALLERVATTEQAIALRRDLRNQLAAAAAWAPNPDSPPLYLDLPTLDGEPRPEILAEFTANAPLAMLAQYVGALQMHDGLALDIGDRDEEIEGARIFEALMSRLRIEHSFEVYEGDHVGRIGERFETEVLPFFSRHLAAQTQ